MFDNAAWERDALRLYKEIAGLASPSTTRDGRDHSGLTVDFTFDDATPPVGLEITTLPDERVLATTEAARRAHQFWRRAVPETGWLVELDERATVRALREPVLALVREGTPIRVDDWRYLDGDKAELARELGRFGLVEVARYADSGPLEVMLSGDGGPRLSTGDLECILNRKAGALQKCRPRHTVLVVGIALWQRIDATDIPIPALPDAVDELWVVHLVAWSTAARSVWRMVRGDDAWSVVPTPAWWMTP